jgi:hypothetical protein
MRTLRPFCTSKMLPVAVGGAYSQLLFMDIGFFNDADEIIEAGVNA